MFQRFAEYYVDCVNIHYTYETRKEIKISKSEHLKHDNLPYIIL